MTSMDPKSKKSMGEKLKQFQQKYKKATDELSRCEDLQTRFVSQFRAAFDIIQRLPMLQDSNNFGSLKNYPDISNNVLGKQMDSLNKIMVSMNQTMYEFGSVIKSLEKIVRDSRQLIKGESDKQLQLWIGVRPSLAYCMEGLETLRNIHNLEFLLKKSLFTALSTLVFKPNADDLCALQQILVDQPNISKEEGLIPPPPQAWRRWRKLETPSLTAHLWRASAGRALVNKSAGCKEDSRNRGSRKPEEKC